VVSRFVAKRPADCKRKIREIAFFLVEGQTQLFEAGTCDFPAARPPPARGSVFPALTKEPKADFESIHANTCYHEQHCGQEKLSGFTKNARIPCWAALFSSTMNKTSSIRGISAAVVALGLSSCLEINETVNLKKDGSGTIVEETILGAQASAMIQMAALQGGENAAPDMFGEDAAKKRAEKFGKGVTVAKVEKINQDGRTGSRVTFTFTDINTVTLDMGDGASSLSAMSPEAANAAEEKVGDTKPITFEYKDGQLTILNPQPKKEDIAAAKDAAAKADTPAGEAVPEAGAEAAQMQAMAMQMMKDMKMSAKIVIEPGIAKTDATYHDDKTITLMEMDMGKLMANPEMMKQMQNLNLQDPAALEEKLKGLEGIKGERKEKVTATVK
jgi:hypothetical protein